MDKGQLATYRRGIMAMVNIAEKAFLYCKTAVSYLSLFCGAICFLWAVLGLTYVICDYSGHRFPIMKWMPENEVMEPISIIAIFLGILGLVWKKNRSSQVRALVGLILGSLFWVLLWMIRSSY